MYIQYTWIFLSFFIPNRFDYPAMQYLPFGFIINSLRYGNCCILYISTIEVRQFCNFACIHIQFKKFLQRRCRRRYICNPVISCIHAEKCFFCIFDDGFPSILIVSNNPCMIFFCFQTVKSTIHYCALFSSAKSNIRSYAVIHGTIRFTYRNNHAIFNCADISSFIDTIFLHVRCLKKQCFIQ